MREDQAEKLMNLLGISVTKKLYNADKGTNFLACCPFHGERHPSFAVNIDKEVYNCFACDAHGTLVQMVSELKGIGLGEAYNILEEFGNVDRREVKSRTLRRYDKED